MSDSDIVLEIVVVEGFVIRADSLSLDDHHEGVPPSSGPSCRGLIRLCFFDFTLSILHK